MACMCGDTQCPSCGAAQGTFEGTNVEYTFAEYHDRVKASVLPQFPNFGDNLVYPALGAAAEAGELADKIKKLWRDHGITTRSGIEEARCDGTKCYGDTNGDHHSESCSYGVACKLRDGAIKEIGDVLWYLDALAHTLGTTLAGCAQLNVQKLTSRAERGTSLGSGDDR
jgi:NTP pyrophosphatase (non-canonical NTP hydrolase)